MIVSQQSLKKVTFKKKSSIFSSSLFLFHSKCEQTFLLCLWVQLATLIIVEGGQSYAVIRPLSLCGIAPCAV